MESELCDIGIKSEEIEILDVKLEQEEDFGDDIPFIGFHNCELDVKVPNVNKELSALKEDDRISGDKIVFLYKGEGDIGKRNNLNEIAENHSVTEIEYSKTAQDSITCPGIDTLPKYYKKTVNKKLHKLLRNIQDDNYSSSKAVVLKQKLLTLCYKNPSKFAHNLSTVKKKGKMAGGKKVLKRKIVTKNMGNSKAPCKKSLSSEDLQGSNSFKNSTVSKNSFITLNEDNLVSSDSSHIAQNDSNKPVISEKPYICPFCDFRTCFHNILINHQRRHNIRQPFACSKCNYSSANKYTLQRHVELVHEKPQNISCNECDFKCSSQIQLKNHMLVHTRNNYFQCSECDYKHVKQAGVKRHMIKHLDNNVHLVCSICGYKGVKPEYITRHMEKHHRFELDVEKIFGIPETAKENGDINSPRDTSSHLIKNDNRKIIEKQPVVLLRKCDDDINESNNSTVNMGVIHEQILQDNFLEVAKCGESEEIINPELLNSVQQEEDSSVVLKSTLITKNKNIITSIVKLVDNDKSTKLQLNTWKSKSEIKENVVKPLKSKRGTSIPQTESKQVVVNEVVYNRVNFNSKIAEVYQCNECSFFSVWFDRYEKHVKLHSREYPCDKCDFITNAQTSLTRHKRSKHSQGKDFICKMCDYRCSTSQHLKDHMRCHEKAKRFKCGKCHIRCKTAAALKHHMSIHNSEKPFACDLCDFRTRYKPSLRNHRFVHTGDTKYVCEICNYKFYANASLKKHNMEVHGSSK